MHGLCVWSIFEMYHKTGFYRLTTHRRGAHRIFSHHLILNRNFSQMLLLDHAMQQRVNVTFLRTHLFKLRKRERPVNSDTKICVCVPCWERKSLLSNTAPRAWRPLLHSSGRHRLLLIGITDLAVKIDTCVPLSHHQQQNKWYPQRCLLAHSQLHTILAVVNLLAHNTF